MRIKYNKTALWQNFCGQNQSLKSIPKWPVWLLQCRQIDGSRYLLMLDVSELVLRGLKRLGRVREWPSQNPQDDHSAKINAEDLGALVVLFFFNAMLTGK